jgi:vesicle coat complex subunit
MPEESVRSEAAIALKDILRKYPQARFDVLPHIENCLKQIESAEGKAAVIWIIGEFGADIKQAPYLIEPLLDDVSEESDQRVVLELLSSSMKLFFKRPPEMQYMLGRLLQTVLNDLTNVDLRDRAMLYYRMLQTDPNSASVIMQGTSITANDQGIQEFAEEADNDVKEKMFQEFNSLSVVYRQTSEQFISEEHQVQ